MSKDICNMDTLAKGFPKIASYMERCVAASLVLFDFKDNFVILKGASIFNMIKSWLSIVLHLKITMTKVN